MEAHSVRDVSEGAGGVRFAVRDGALLRCIASWLREVSRRVAGSEQRVPLLCSPGREAQYVAAKRVRTDYCITNVDTIVLQYKKC